MIRFRKFKSPLFVLLLLPFVGCTGTEEPFWNDYFHLVQEGVKQEGIIMSYHQPKPERSPTDMPYIEVEIEYQEEDEQSGHFREVWPNEYKGRFAVGSRVPYYYHPENNLVKRATVVLLEFKKFMPRDASAFPE